MYCKKKAPCFKKGLLPKTHRAPFNVGVAGFEPATSCSQSRRDNRATLHPEGNFAERQGLEPWRPKGRQISNLLHYHSATSPLFSKYKIWKIKIASANVLFQKQSSKIIYYFYTTFFILDIQLLNDKYSSVFS